MCLALVCVEDGLSQIQSHMQLTHKIKFQFALDIKMNYKPTFLNNSKAISENELLYVSVWINTLNLLCEIPIIFHIFWSTVGPRLNISISVHHAILSNFYITETLRLVTCV